MASSESLTQLTGNSYGPSDGSATRTTISGVEGDLNAKRAYKQKYQVMIWVEVVVVMVMVMEYDEGVVVVVMMECD